MGNGFYPGAINRNIPPGSNDPAIKPRVAILHVDAGNASTLYDFFRLRSGGIESHFHVRLDGTVEQYRSIYWQADANHLANDFAVSIETQGYGPGEWTDKQLAAIKALLLWLNKEAGIPLRKIDKWDGSGIGYHTQFGAPGKWTPVAKSCPGPARIAQYHGILVPWFAVATKPVVTANQKARAKVRNALRILKGPARVSPPIKKARQQLREALKATPKK